MPSPDSLLDIASDLYSRPPAEFTQARNARAKEIGDPDVAAEVCAFRKPSVAAWVVNVFARERADELGEALQLAEDLREAQADLDAAELAKLGRQRRALTRRLAERAAELATARGGKVSASTLEAVHQTISAAFFDQGAATAIASGRLVHELEPSSGDSIDLSAAVAAGLADSPAPSPPRVDEVRARRERRQAERAVQAAEKELAGAERDQAQAGITIREATRNAEQLTTRVTELETELRRVRQDAEKATTEVAAAERTHTTAGERVVAAERAVEQARAALDEL